MNHHSGDPQGLGIPANMDKANFHDWCNRNLTQNCVVARWLYFHNNAYTLYMNGHPGVAPQCPENQPLRNLMVMPVG